MQLGDRYRYVEAEIVCSYLAFYDGTVDDVLGTRTCLYPPFPFGFISGIGVDTYTLTFVVSCLSVGYVQHHLIVVNDTAFELI
jgi:hypothetical protein